MLARAAATQSRDHFCYVCPKPTKEDLPLLPEITTLLIGRSFVRTRTIDGSPVGATSIFDCYLRRDDDKLYFTYDDPGAPGGAYRSLNQRGDGQSAPNVAATEDGAAPPFPVFSAGKGSSLGARASVSLACAAALVTAAAVAAAA